MLPNNFYSNKVFHNWLIYKISDDHIQKYKQLYKVKLVNLGSGEASY